MSKFNITPEIEAKLRATPEGYILDGDKLFVLTPGGNVMYFEAPFAADPMTIVKSIRNPK